MFNGKKEPGIEFSDDAKKIEAARLLGVDIPEGSSVSDAKMVAFGISPENGMEGSEFLASLVREVFLGARVAGCPPETIAHFASALLGGFALAVSCAFAGVGEIDEDNHLAKIAAISDQTNKERVEIGASLCEEASQHLEAYGNFLDEHTVEDDTPPLVDSEAAAELTRLFETEGGDHGKD